MNRIDFFAKIWSQYIRMTPQAKRIQALFNARGEHVVNDHVAFRTFDIEGFDLDRATELLAAIGYEAFDNHLPRQALASHSLSCLGGCECTQDRL